MLPTQPPPLSEMDFDPDATDNEDEDDPQEPTIQISSIEVNYLVYQASSLHVVGRIQADEQYLLESNFKHSAFSLLKESGLEETELYKHFTPKQPSKGKGRSGKDSSAVSTFGDQHGRLAPGELIRKLWTAVKWEEVERHIGPDGVSSPYLCIYMAKS
jgi:transducin (beta)-like 1